MTIELDEVSPQLGDMFVCPNGYWGIFTADDTAVVFDREGIPVPEDFDIALLMKMVIITEAHEVIQSIGELLFEECFPNEVN